MPKRLVLLMVLVGVWLMNAPAAHAHTPTPVQGGATVELISITADVDIFTDENGLTWAAVEAAYKLHNVSKTSAAFVQFGWPAWSGGALNSDPAALVDFQVRRNGQALTLTPIEMPLSLAGETRTTTVWTTAATLARDERTTFTASWRQLLGEGPLVTWEFGLLPAARWRGAVGSTRITVNLPELTTQEQLVRVSPTEFAYSGEYTFYGDRVEWIFVSYLPDTNVSLTLIAPPLWREMEALRTALATQPNADAWLRLGDIYTQLADAGASEYDAQAEAAYLAARDADPTNPEPHRRLWQRFVARLGSPPDLAMLDLARQEAQALYDLTGDEAARAFIVEAESTLAQEWLARNALDRAYERFAHAWELATASERAALESLRSRLLTQRLHATLQKEGVAALFSEAETLNATDLIAPLMDVPRPWFERRAVQVATTPSGRTVTLTFYNVQDEAAARIALDRACGEMSRVVSLDTHVRCAVPLPNAEVVITFDGNDPALWRERAAALLPTIPDNATFDLLRSVLQASAIEWRLSDGWRALRVHYVEEIHLLPPQALTLAETIRAQAEAAETPLVRDALNAIADAWLNVAQNESVRYEIFFTHNGRTLTRAWTRTPPAEERLTFEATFPNVRFWLAVAGVLMVAVVGVLALIWRWPLPERITLRL
ncbi:TolC family protein [Ardenticatena maritima]|nr:hypothetical protein [Ardenticatena maritima]KPL87771.1 hypothetical protein SE16_09335 [Ardenticatena maritima]